MKTRTRRIESLEPRQLMAFDLVAPIDPRFMVNSNSAYSASEVSQQPVAQYNYWESVQATGLITQVDKTTVFVTNRYDGTGQIVWGVKQTDAGLETIFKTELDFSAYQIINAEDRIYLIGNSVVPRPSPMTWETNSDGLTLRPDFWQPQTKFAAIDPATGRVLAEETLGSEILQVRPMGDKLLVVTQNWNGYPWYGIHLPPDEHVGIAINRSDFVPQLPTTKLNLFGIGAKGFEKLATQEIARGQMLFSGSEVIVAAEPFYYPVEWLQVADPNASSNAPAPREEPYKPTTEFTRYRIDGNQIKQVGEAIKRDGTVTGFTFSKDEKSLLTVRLVADGTENRNIFEQYALGDAGLRLTKSAAIDGDGKYLSNAYLDENVLISIKYGEASQSLLITQLTDIKEGIAKTQELTLDGSYLGFFSFVKVGDQFVGLVQRQEPFSITLDPNGARTTANDAMLPYISQQSIVILTAKDGVYQIAEALNANQWMSDIRVIDAEAKRISVYSSGLGEDGTWKQGFFVGRLEGEKFIREGELTLNSSYSLNFGADQVAVQTLGQLSIYGYDDLSEPLEVFVLPVPDLPPPVATNDRLVRFSDGNEQLLDVLANDRGYAPLLIAELIDAPEGVTIVDGKYVKVSAAAMSASESIKFSYRVSDGVKSDTAEVELRVRSVSQPRIDALVEEVKLQAVRDFGVKIQDVQVLRVSPLIFTDLHLIDVNITALDWKDSHSYFYVTLQLPDVMVDYTVTVDGDITKVQVLDTRPQVQIALRAVDEQGQPLNQVNVDEAFWVEVLADDLRTAGGGLFSTSLDLVLPRNVRLEGDIEYVSPFKSIAGSQVSESGFVQVGAIYGDPRQPGGAEQVVMRFKLKALEASSIVLMPQLSTGVGAETLLFGRNEVVDPRNVLLSPLTVGAVTTEDPQDVDGDGTIKPLDVLQVINFIEANGVGSMSDIAEKMLAMESMPGPNVLVGSAGDRHGEMLKALRRFDVTRDSRITPLDALVVINRINSENVGRGSAEYDEAMADLFVDPTTLSDSGTLNKRKR